MSPNANEPQTDREFLIMINDHVIELKEDMKEVKKNLSGTINAEYCYKEHKEIKGRFTDYDKRIRGLESWRWWLMGGISIIYFIIIIFFQMLSKYS